MWEWIKAYAEQFGATFPVYAYLKDTPYEVDAREYDCVQIIRECCASNKTYEELYGKYTEALEEEALEEAPKKTTVKKTTKKVENPTE